jgi:hypothetical protein
MDERIVKIFKEFRFIFPPFSGKKPVRRQNMQEKGANTIPERKLHLIGPET